MTLSSCTNIYTNIHSLSQFCTCHNLHFFLCLTTGVLQLWIILFLMISTYFMSLCMLSFENICGLCVGNYSFSKKIQEIPVRKIIFWCFKLFMVGGSIKSIIVNLFFKKEGKKILKMTLLCLVAGSKNMATIA